MQTIPHLINQKTLYRLVVNWQNMCAAYMGLCSNNRSLAPAVTFPRLSVCRGLGRTASMRRFKWETNENARPFFDAGKKTAAVVCSHGHKVMPLPSAVTRTVISHFGYYSVLGWKKYLVVFCYFWGKMSALWCLVSAWLPRASLLKDG